MEFHEKLHKLRKDRGLTQEELAEALYVSRTAISKWESGRGYPSIESLKEISKFFSISIDDLLSSEKVLSIAEKENKANIRKIYNLLFGVVDVCVIFMIVMPLYPNEVGEYIYSVNLFAYTQSTSLTYFMYWGMFLFLIISGILKIVVTQFGIEKRETIVTFLSMVFHIVTVILLALTRTVYATTMMFLLLVIKGYISTRG